jgi:hypothetical protein
VTPHQQQQPHQQAAKMSYSKAARSASCCATEYVEQLPITKQQTAAAKLLTSGRHPENNRPVTSKPPIAKRLNNIGDLETVEDIKNDNLRNRVTKMKWLYIQGLSRLPFGEIRRLLRTFVFDTANIANIRNIASNIHEFVLYSPEAADTLKEIFTKNITNTTILPDDYAFWKLSPRPWNLKQPNK